MYQFPPEELSDEDLPLEYQAWLDTAESLRKQAVRLLESEAEYLVCAGNVLAEMKRRASKE